MTIGTAILIGAILTGAVLLIFAALVVAFIAADEGRWGITAAILIALIFILISTAVYFGGVTP